MNWHAHLDRANGVWKSQRQYQYKLIPMSTSKLLFVFALCSCCQMHTHLTLHACQYQAAGCIKINQEIEDKTEYL